MRGVISVTPTHAEAETASVAYMKKFTGMEPSGPVAGVKDRASKRSAGTRPARHPAENPHPFIRPQYQRRASGTTKQASSPLSIQLHNTFKALPLFRCDSTTA